jgi:predicted phosphodiesterase
MSTIPQLIETGDDELVVIASDIHFPHHDQAAVDALLRLIEIEQPQRIVLNGDVQDFYTLSQFDKNRNRKQTLQDELDLGNAFRARVREIAPDAVIHECEGNHEARLQVWLNAQPDGLGSLRSNELATLLDHVPLDIHTHGDEGFLLKHNFWIKHGNFVANDGGMSAKKEMMRAWCNGASGHVHRLSDYKLRQLNGRTFRWYEGGCLCDLEADYVKGGVPNWEQGFLVGQFGRDSFKVDCVPVEDGIATWGRQVY